MRVILNSTYTGEQEVFEGDPSSIYSQIVSAYPFLETHDEEYQGDLDSLLEDMNSMQIFDAYIEGSEDLDAEDDEEDVPSLRLEGDQLDKSDFYVEYQNLEKGEKLPHYLKFMGDHPKAQETAEWADSNLNHRNLAEFAMRHAKTKPEGLSEEEKAQVKHFGDSLHMPEVQKAAGQLNKKHNFESGMKLLEDAHVQYTQRHAASAPKLVPEEGQKLLDLGDGVAAYNLGKQKNENEATAMGHCATPHAGGELWSIRKNHSNGMVEPLVTLSHQDGYIGEVKGKYNWKPSEKHHPYIAKLMASDLVKGFVGGGYAPESNFEFSDMKDGLRRKLLEHKPALTAKVYKELLPQGFQGDYNHSPEIKSIFNSNDANAQIEHLKSLPADSGIHEQAAKNPNTSHEALRYLIDSHKNSDPAIRATVYSAIASNPNVPSELLHHLVTTDAGDEVLNHFGVNLNKVNKNAARNKQASSETHRFLIDKAKEKYEKSDDDEEDFRQLAHIKELVAGNSSSHPKILEDLANEHLKTYSLSNSSRDIVENLVGNENLPQNVLKQIVESAQPNSGIHDSAAFNRKASPELLQYLADVSPNTHSRIAYNPSAPKELLARLSNLHKPGSQVHKSLARNPEASPDLLEDLYAKNNNPSDIEDERKLFYKNRSRDEINQHLSNNPNASTKLLTQLIDQNGFVLQSKFSKLPPEYQKKVRPLAGENIQKIISLMNDENDFLAQQANEARDELMWRRKAKYDKILSPEGNLEQLQHLAESHDDEISKRARAELKRRGLSKSELILEKAIPESETDIESFRNSWNSQVLSWQYGFNPDNELEEAELEKSDWGTPLFQTHDWKYLGSGHQGHVYQASPEAVVKVSKTTPFNKFNPQKTPAQARKDVMDEHESITGLQGHPLVPKHHGTWRKGGKVYLAREALTPIKDGELNEGELDKVREQMYDAFKSGYKPIDQIQLGKNAQGQIKIMDMGGIKKRTSKSATGVDWDKEDLTNHLKNLFSQHGQDPKAHKHTPTEILQEEVGKLSNVSHFLGSKEEFVDRKNSRMNELARRAQAAENPVTKSESFNLNLVNGDKHSALRVARYMLGFAPQSNIVFDSAKFLVAGKPLSLDVIRRAIYEKDGNLEEAALQAYGLEINDSNLKALRAVVRTKQAETDTSAELGLQKKEDSNSVQVKQITPALPEGYEAAEFVQRASESDNISHIKLHGKHSTGSLLAIDPQSNHMMLLKPNFGGPGPAAGVQEELASPAKREVAFSHVARHWGLSKWVPQADLLNLDGKEFAAIHVLPWSWQGLEKLREADSSKLLRMLNKYLAVGTLHKWAVLDYVLGNTDRHGQNMMGDFETEELALIDHGSTMAGPSFNPSNDNNSFIPFYLRILTSGKFNLLNLQEKLRSMPTLSNAVDKEVSGWILSLSSEDLESMLRKYGINPTPALNRLRTLRQKIAHHNRADQSINSLWVTT